MLKDEIAPTDCLEFIEEETNEKVALIELADAEVPRVGERVRFHTEGTDVEVTYEVKKVTHHYGKRWESGVPSLLKVSILLKK